MQQLNEFIAANNGHALDYDHQYGAQCMDEIQFWAQKLGKRTFSGNAINVPGQNHDQWAWIANTASNVPTPGSIMCFASNNKAAGTGPFGHVDIFVSGNSSQWTGFDQNWGGAQYCRSVLHSYTGVMGWLQPTGVSAPPPPAPAGGTARCVRTVNVRTAPDTSATVTSVLQPGNTFNYTNKVVGQDVNLNGVHTNLWYHSTLGHYVWAGNCTG